MFIGALLSLCTMFHFMMYFTSEWLFQQLGVIELLLRYFGIYSMIYFVFKKASKPLKNRNIWFNYGLKPVFLCSLIFNFGFIIFLEVKFHQASDLTQSSEERANAITSLSCNSPIWISSSIFEFITVMIFLSFVIKIDETVSK